MSGATYRIETSHEPERVDDNLPWIARIYRLSDETPVGSAWGATEDGAILDARDKIKAYTDRLGGKTLFADDHGDLTPPPSLVSVKV